MVRIFLWVGFVDPHRPYQDSVNAAPVLHSPQDVTVPPFLVNDRRTREDLARYYDEISRMDNHISRFLNILKERQLDDNTVVMFISDNGFPFPRGKATLYDAGIRTPLIIRWPGKIPPGSSYRGLISTVDLAPTILEMAGVEIPSGMYGKSFLQVFSDPSLIMNRYVFAERNWHDSDEHMRCIRSGKYKLIINAYIDLPHGITGDYTRSGAWKSLMGIIKDWMKETRDYPPNRKRMLDDIDRVTGFRLRDIYDMEYYE